MNLFIELNEEKVATLFFISIGSVRKTCKHHGSLTDNLVKPTITTRTLENYHYL